MRRLVAGLAVAAGVAASCGGPGLAASPVGGRALPGPAAVAPLAPMARLGHAGDGSPARMAVLRPRPDPNHRSLIGTVVADLIEARRWPNPEARVLGVFGRTNPQGSPQVFLLLDRVTGADGRSWYRALLPVRPNGSTGFLAALGLRVTWTDYRLVVDREARKLTVLEAGERVVTYPIGLGAAATPTPAGLYYLHSLLRPPTAGSVYGTYAYGLSAYSEVITDWEGGGIVGIHGTNDPSSIGRQMSHGCIRLLNAHIEQLVRLLPLGTPVQIL